MNINYQFADMIGISYRNGNAQFMPKGKAVLSPIGNKLKLIDLGGDFAKTLAIQSTTNVSRIAINNAGTHAFIVGKDGNCLFANLASEVILHRVKLGQGNEIKCAEFSPDDSSLAVSVDGQVRVFSLSAFTAGQFNPMMLASQRALSTEPVACLKWSHDGRILASGGTDRVLRIFSSRFQFANMSCVLMSQRYPLVSVDFYEANSYDVLSIDSGGMAVLWEASLAPHQLILKNSKKEEEEGGEEAPGTMLSYKKMARSNLMEHSGSVFGAVSVTSASYSSKLRLLVVAFSSGVFLVVELPEFTLLQNFRVSEMRINAVDINERGDWILLACGYGSEAQLVVWEWKSETYILKQQSHSQTVVSAAFSPDGLRLATGAEDGKVKIWNCRTGFCQVTFTEHGAGVTDVCFTQSGRAVLSSSLEGTVRAHDMKRYRNFRTMAAPKQTQLNALCSDQSGELVVASSRELYEIYVWSLDTGGLLDVLTGHTSQITGLSCFESTLASVSLDKTLRMWNLVERTNNEAIQLLNEGLDVKHSPCGHLLAALCYDSCISIFSTATSAQLGNIETRLDVDAARGSKDRIKKSTSGKNKSFTCLSFSPDSLLLLAGGQSNTFCLYSVPDRLVLRRFKLTANASLDGVLLDVDYRKFTEFGNVELFDLSDSEDETDKERKRLKLPGTTHSDMSERSLNPTISICKLAFSPNGRDFAAVSTEGGVSIFTLDARKRFDPFQLEAEVTPQMVEHHLSQSNYSSAICLALRLNDPTLIERAVESLATPQQMKAVVQGITVTYAEKLLAWIGANESASWRKVHFYQLLIHELLLCYAADLKRMNLVPILSSVERVRTDLAKLSEENRHSLQFLIAARRAHSAKRARNG